MNHLDDHFDEMTALLHLEGQLDAERAHEVSAHLASCAACRDLLRALEREGVWLREALAADEEAIPARLVEAPSRGAAPWGWIAAFGLGAGGVYTLWSGFIEPWRAQAAQAGFTQGNLLTILFFSGAFWKGWDAMRSMMEFLAMATLGVVLIWLLRRQWRRFTTVAVVMGALFCALALPPSASAAQVEHGHPNYTLPAGQEVHTDLIVAADHTRIDGDVDGDLIVFSNSVAVNGHIKGDIIAFSNELRVNGEVDGNIRAFSNTLLLNGPVAKNLTAFVNTMEMDEKSSVGGTMTIFANNAELNGRVTGDLLAAVASLDINGSLGHDAQIRAEKLTVGSGAEVKGHTKFVGRRQPDVAFGAKLGSPIDVTIRRRGPNYASWRYYWHQTLFWGAGFVFGLVLLLLAPAFYSDVERATKRIGPAMGLGVLLLFATPIVAIIACITIVGLGVGIAVLLQYFVAVYVASIFVGSWLGERLLGERIGVGPAIGRLALGLAVLHALRMLPYAGPLITLVIVVWGLGAQALAIYKRVRPQTAAAA